MANENLTVEIVSDVVCPWCYIGKRRIEKALKLTGRSDIGLRWLAYELNPGTPKNGVPWETFMCSKFGSPPYARQVEKYVARAALLEEITLRFDLIERLANTFDAHRLIWLAGTMGDQAGIVERLYQAYFCEGRDIGSRDVLAAIAGEAGFNPSGTRDFLVSDSGVKEVFAEWETSRRRGVDGVPSFFLDGVHIASGAQKPEHLATMLMDALQRLERRNNSAL